MAFSINDTTNPSETKSSLNLIQSLNTMAFILKRITGKSSWKITPTISLASLSETMAPLSHQHAIAEVSGLQLALDSKSSTGHQHAIAEVSGLQLALDSKASVNHEHALGAWQEVILTSPWTNNITGSAVPRCRKIIGNLIEVRGTIKKGAAPSANETVATLPIGYRPSETSYFITWAGNGYCRLQVDPNGSIKVNITGSNGTAALNFIFGLD